MEENVIVSQNDEIEIDLVELFFFLLSKIVYMIIAAAALGGLALIVNLFLIKPTYTSSTKMYVLNRQSSDTLTQADLNSSTYLTNDYMELIKSRTVLEAVIQEMGLNMSYEDLRGKISVSSERDTRIITVSVNDHDPAMARDIANAIREESSEHIEKVMKIEAVNVVDVANLPNKKSSPKIKRNVLIAALLGGFLVAVYFIIRFMMNDKINTSEDVERYLQLSVLGSLPVDENLQKVSKKKKNRHKRTVSRKKR